MNGDLLALDCEDTLLELLPDTGGAVARLVFKGQDVLRPAGPGESDAMDTALFALVPYANRIAQGAFQWRDRAIRQACNYPGQLHPLHGHGWRGHWRLQEHDQTSATVVFDDVPSDWPWPYTAEQSFSLSPGNLRIALSLTNRAAEVMPYSLGFHPWFPNLPGTRLTAMVDDVWLSAEDCIPTNRAPAVHFADFSRGAALAEAPFIDHCFTGFRGAVIIDQPDRNLTLTLSASPACGFLHLYVPRDRAVFCAEPVTAMPDAFNRTEPQEQTGLRVLEPGKTVSVWMNLAMKAEA